MSQIKTFFIPTTGKPLIKTKEVEVPTGETKKGLFGGEKPVMRKEQQQEITGYSDCFMDGFALVNAMHEVINPWLEQGYELFSITPIISGNYDWKYEKNYINNGNGQGSYGYGYGYSYTEGIMVVLKKT